MTKQEVIEQVKSSQSSIISKDDLLEMLAKVEGKSQRDSYIEILTDEIGYAVSSNDESFDIDEDDIKFRIYGRQIDFDIRGIEVKTDDFLDSVKDYLLEFVEDMELDE